MASFERRERAVVLTAVDDEDLNSRGSSDGVKRRRQRRRVVEDRNDHRRDGLKHDRSGNPLMTVAANSAGLHLKRRTARHLTNRLEPLEKDAERRTKRDVRKQHGRCKVPAEITTEKADAQ